MVIAESQTQEERMDAAVVDRTFTKGTLLGFLGQSPKGSVVRDMHFRSIAPVLSGERNASFNEFHIKSPEFEFSYEIVFNNSEFVARFLSMPLCDQQVFLRDVRFAFRHDREKTLEIEFDWSKEAKRILKIEWVGKGAEPQRLKFVL